MSKLKALWTGEYDKYWDEVFTDRFELSKAGRAYAGSENDNVKRMDEEELIPLLKDVEVFIDGYDRITEKVINGAENLKLVLSIRDGPEETVDIDACTKAGIPVLFPGGRCMRSVAELTVALILMCAKPIVTQTNRIRSEGITTENKKDYSKMNGEYFEVFGKTLGIVGIGRNTSALATYMNAMGMKSIAYDPYCSSKRAEELNVELVSLDEVMSKADYVVLGARVTAETKGMIGERELSLMKPTACFINTARAELVDNVALIKALKDNKIRKAAIDVFEKDPVTKQDLPVDQNSMYFDIEANRLIMTPHMAGFSMERTYNAYALLEPSWNNFLKGDKNLVIKNPDVFDSPNFVNRGGKLFGIDK